MPINSREALGVPPDGAGKKLQVGRIIVVDYTGGSGYGAFKHGMVITGGTSGVTGLIVAVSEASAATGTIDVYPNPKELDFSTFTVAETITTTGGTATVSAVADLYLSQSVIVGGNDPMNQMSVDENGSVSMRFADGDPSLDLMGAQMASNVTALGSYVSQYEDSEGEFGYLATGVNAHSQNPDTRGILLTVGAGNGNSIIRRTNWTHYYQQGASLTARMAIACPDPSKTNVLRRWGLFDDSNGIGFLLQDGVLSVGYRSYSTGSIVDVAVPQSSWNIDKLNGVGGAENLSTLDIDLSVVNNYWMEYRWSGTAVVKFGVYSGGHKVACHEFVLDNVSALSAFPYGSFPLSAQLTTTGPTGSSTDMLIYSANVESSIPITAWTQPRFIFNEPKVIDHADGFTPLVSIRAAATYHGIRNDVWAGITTCDVASLTSAATADQFSLFKAVYDPVLTGAVWETIDESAVEYDVTATVADDTGCSVIAMWVAQGAHSHRFPAVSIYDADGVGLNADGSPTVVTISSRPLHAGESSVAAVLSWEELR